MTAPPLPNAERLATLQRQLIGLKDGDHVGAWLGRVQLTVGELRALLAHAQERALVTDSETLPAGRLRYWRDLAEETMDAFRENGHCLRVPPDEMLEMVSRLLPARDTRNPAAGEPPSEV